MSSTKKSLKSAIKEHYFAARNCYRFCFVLLAILLTGFIAGSAYASLEANESRDKIVICAVAAVGILSLICIFALLIQSIRLSGRLIKKLQDYPEKKKFLIKLEDKVRKFKFWCWMFFLGLLFGMLVVIPLIFIIVRFKELEKTVSSVI